MLVDCTIHLHSKLRSVHAHCNTTNFEELGFSIAWRKVISDTVIQLMAPYYNNLSKSKRKIMTERN